MNEAEAIRVVCAILGGEPEVRHILDLHAETTHISVDCETETHAIEVGLDKRSSFDSIQQAQFAAWLTDKEPMVIMIDRDGELSAIEYRIRTAARQSGIAHVVYSDDYLMRWWMTSYFRDRRAALLAQNGG